MYLIFSLVTALVGAVLTALFAPPHPAFAPLFFLLYFAAMLALLFVFGILAAPFLSKKRIPKKPNRFARFMLVEAYTIGLAFMRIRCRVTGRELLPPRGTSFLLVCNHLSNFDHMLMIVKLRHYPISFISKPENFRIPIIGRYLWNSGFLAIDRSSARNAVTTVNETARRIAECGMCYGVFPEGTRSRTGKLLPFHSGVFHSAARAKAPVLVLHIQGTDRVFHNMPWRPTRVEMEILDCIDSGFVSTHTDVQISERAYERMVACVHLHGGEVAERKPAKTVTAESSTPGSISSAAPLSAPEESGTTPAVGGQTVGAEHLPHESEKKS